MLRRQHMRASRTLSVERLLDVAAVLAAPGRSERAGTQKGSWKGIVVALQPSATMTSRSDCDCSIIAQRSGGLHPAY